MAHHAGLLILFHSLRLSPCRPVFFPPRLLSTLSSFRPVFFPPRLLSIGAIFQRVMRLFAGNDPLVDARRVREIAPFRLAEKGLAAWCGIMVNPNQSRVFADHLRITKRQSSFSGERVRSNQSYVPVGYRVDPISRETSLYMPAPGYVPPGHMNLALIANSCGLQLNRSTQRHGTLPFNKAKPGTVLVRAIFAQYADRFSPSRRVELDQPFVDISRQHNLHNCIYVQYFICARQ